MPDKGGAWLSPWLPLLDVDTLKRCMEFRPAPLTGLADLPIASATTRLDKAMKTVFFPTAQCVEFAWMVVQRVIENLVENYPSFETYKDAIYSGEPNLPMETIPMLLTGHAGIGKSALGDAILRAVKASGSAVVDVDNLSIGLRPLVQIRIQMATTAKSMLHQIGASGTDVIALLEAARQLLYRDCTGLMLPDEFQFHGQSSGATAAVTKLLYAFSYLGPLWCYIANFSLGWRLLKRSPEDRQRLLIDPVIMQPEDPESTDWIETVSSLISVAPEFFKIDLKTDGPELGLNCGGQKRALRRLLAIAYMLQSGKSKRSMVVVTMDSIKEAKKHNQFEQFRTDIHEIYRRAAARTSKKDNLSCPFSQAPSITQAFQAAAQRARTQQVADKQIDAAMTGGERDAVQWIQQNLNQGSGRNADRRGKKGKTQQAANQYAENTKAFAQEFLK